MRSNHSNIFTSLTLLAFVGFAGWIVANDFSIYVPSSEVVYGAGAEQCDDGNDLDGDGCSRLCQNEGLCKNSVRNGELNSGEQCDDGNDVNTDACDNYCRLTVCGDGIVQDPNSRGQNETCDDGNALVGDGCSSVCVLETVECGDRIVNGTEECDDGKRCDNTGDFCNSNNDCYGGATCGTYAGDGCGGDGGTPPAPSGVCGNSIVEDEELCDDGNTTDGDGCSATCIVESCLFCTACPLPTRWFVDFSGVTDNSCGECDQVNQSFELKYDYCDTYSVSNPDCCWANSDDNLACSIGSPIVLSGGEGGGGPVDWEIKVMDAVYTIPSAEWDCYGTNVFQYSSDTGMCGNWPSEVTITSQWGSMFCQEVCYNNFDDNGDTNFDCADFDCPDGSICGSNGMQCSSGACECPGGGTEVCDSGGDEDCDGLTNCADTADCSSHPSCSGTPEDCDAVGDEDGDGDANCADTTDCPDGTTCAANGMQCSSGSCECPGGGTEVCDSGGDEDCDGLTNCADTADCSTHPSCSGTPEICDVVGDEDGDGDWDCEDTDSCYDGDACDANGSECDAESCECPTGETEETGYCDDEYDDDCDGDTDCDDSDCSGDPACSGTPEDCDAVGDEDSDGDWDCADSDCPDGTTCAANGMQCSSGACECPGGGTEVCDSGGDEDCDGLTNCADTADCSTHPSCSGTPEDCDAVGDEDGDGDWDCEDTDCPDGTTCDANGSQCYYGSCECPTGETEETGYCDDEYDDDCDGDTDCDDSDCSGDPACGGSSSSGGTEICDNGEDDDGDDEEDCEDEDCEGHPYCEEE
jgi:cysteine-rich repeat protein